MRYTKKQLKEMSAVDFIITVLEERRDKCTNPYSPLCERLNAIINKLYTDRRIEEE
jgi:hypothetical protein